MFLEIPVCQQRSTPTVISDAFSRGHVRITLAAQHMLAPSSMSVVWFVCRCPMFNEGPVAQHMLVHLQ